MSMINTSAKTPLYQELYQKLREKIVSGEYPVGFKIPSEKQIAEENGVSRITSKHALDQLVREGYIKRYPGKGSFVQSQTGTLVAAPQTAAEPASNPRLIGVIMEALSTDFGVDILMGVEQQCALSGYSVVVKFSYGSENREIDCVQELLDAGVSGILLMCVYSEVYSPTVMQLSLDGFPMLFMDRALRGLPIPYVGTNHLEAAKQLTNELIARGHSQLALVINENSHTTSSAEDRTLGYVESCLDHNLLCANKRLLIGREGVIPPGPQEQQAAIDRIHSFIQENPDTKAFLAITCGIASAILQALDPKTAHEYIVAAFDGPTRQTDQSCKLLYVQQDQKQMGRTACAQLIEKINGRDVPHTTYVPYRIITNEAG